jgi:osmotically-inducible protein OsmY
MIPQPCQRAVLILLVCAGLWGCSDQDADRISRVSGKALTKATELTTQARGRISLSLRNPTVSLNDTELGARVEARLAWDEALKGAKIKAEASGGEVTLTGTVAQEPQRQRAVDLAQSTLGVNKVTDRLELVPARE